jgi:NADH:ubiquinone oxidoreductase subunit 6 (subunit J)
MMAGSVLADFSIYRRLNKYLIADKQKAVTILEGPAKLPVLIGVGAALLILTGVGMVSIFRESVTSMLWFRVKMILVLLVLLNGIVLARPGAVKLRATLLQNAAQDNRRIEGLGKNLRTIYVLQLVLFLSIFILSVFRP